MKQEEVSNKLTSRKKKILIGIIAALLLGAAYFTVIKLTGFYVPCIFRMVTGLKCPGCGVAHMCRGVIETCIAGIGGSLSGSFFSNLMLAASENYFLFFTSPFIAFEIIYSLRCAWNKKRMPRVNEIILFVYIALLIAWAVARNVVGW